MPTIDWNAQWVRLLGGRYSGGIVSSPRTGSVKEFCASNEPR